MNHIETHILKMDILRTGDYHVTFLSRHPVNNHICDDKARWWTEWREYYLDNENVPVYGARILFSPKRKLDERKYMVWYI